MAKSKVNSQKRRVRPALTPDSREAQMISMAMDLAEQQLLDGTASSQVVAHFLKLGSSRQRLENIKLERENELLKAKTDAIESAKNVEKLYSEALAAMKSYSGAESIEDD